MPLIKYRLATDYLAESFKVSHFMVATRSGTSIAGIELPPVHGAQKAADTAFIPESQFNFKQSLLKPISITPGRKGSQPICKTNHFSNSHQ